MVRAARLRFYRDSQLDARANPKDAFGQPWEQGGCNMEDILVVVAEAADGSIIIFADWTGFRADERSWHPWRRFCRLGSDVRAVAAGETDTHPEELCARECSVYAGSRVHEQ